MKEYQLTSKFSSALSLTSLILLVIALSMSFVGQGEPPWLTAIYQPLLDLLEPWYRFHPFFHPFYWLAFGLSLIGTLLALVGSWVRVNHLRLLAQISLAFGIFLTLWTWLVAAGGL